MELLVPILCLLVGLVVGWLVVRSIHTSKLQGLEEKVRSECLADLARAQEQCQAGAKAMEELKAQLKAAEEDLRTQRAQNATEVERRSSAEEKANRIPSLEETIQKLREELEGLSTQHADLNARMEEERKAAAEKLALLDAMQHKLSDAFKALSSEALRSNNQSFLELAKLTLAQFQEAAKGDLEVRQKGISELVSPLKESLKQVGASLQELEKTRLSAYTGLCEQVKSLTGAHADLKNETAKLVNALHKPIVRGRWGEIQLRRVVELAGMTPFCDFTEQESVTTEEGRLRPDLTVKLPGGKNVVVDSKAPLDAYLNAVDAPDEESRNRYMDIHARQIKDHIVRLGQKAYWDHLRPTPEFVVMFLPGEAFFSAALERNPDLLEEGVRNRVIVASPTTLISLLKAVAYGWNQERIAESAQEVNRLGREIYERLAVMTEHLEGLGKRLGGAVDFYNKAVGSFETRVLVSARKFPEFGIGSGKDLPLVPPLEKMPRQLATLELDDSAAIGAVPDDKKG